MRELTDRWVLPLAGRTIIRCCIDNTFGIEFSGDDSTDVSITIGGTFDFNDEGEAWRLRPEDAAPALAPAFGMLGRTVDSAEAHKDGTLEVAFADGSRLHVAPDPDYEAWEYAGPHGAKAVSLPGGDVAVWRPAA